MISGLNQGLVQEIGQLLLVGFPDAKEALPTAVERALQSGQVGGTILFRRNVGTIDQLLGLTAQIHEAAKNASAPPFVAVDQEGGRVVRIKEPLTPIPPMRRLGEAADLRKIAEVSEVIATEIGALGFNLNFAPVLDVDTNPDNPVIGDRSFSYDPQRVARCGAGFLVGHHTAGVIPCGKHFPGHGDTILDSHIDLPRVDHDEGRLKAVELFPFERAIVAGIPMIMTAHIEVPALDPALPATFSRPILTDLLRKRLKFEGVIITDCLEMKAVADRFEIEEMIDLGVEAGVDIFLISHSEEKWQAAFKRLYDLASSNTEIRARIEESARRIRTIKGELLGHWQRPWKPAASVKEILGCPEHQAIMAPFLSTPVEGTDPTEVS